MTLPGTRARGENVKLLLEDAGLDHEYVRVKRDDKDYGSFRAQLIKDGLCSPTLPCIEMGGKKFGKTVPIMRYLSVKLGRKYHGSNDEEDQLLDSIADTTDAWFEALKYAFFGTDVSSILDLFLLYF